MDTLIKKPIQSGKIAAIPSKSFAHRALICAALSDRETKIYCTSISADIEATVSCLNALGAEISRDNDCYTVRPIEKAVHNCTVNCGESGSTLRFLLPVICALGVSARIIMQGRLKDRPLSPLREVLCDNGCVLKKEDDIICTSGRLKSGRYEISSSVSSQYISGLLLALPLCEGDSVLTLAGRVESAPYIEMTTQVQGSFGIDNKPDGNSYNIKGNTVYTSPQSFAVEGDWSNGAFWLCAGALIKGGMTVSGLDINSAQGDRKIIEILKDFGADVLINDSKITVKRGKLKGIELDASDIPDLVPIVSLVASAAEGTTTITGVGRLRLKESDRIVSTTQLLKAIGCRVESSDNALTIHGGGQLCGGIISSFNDHRIAMTAAVASILTDGDIIVKQSEAVNKSYPDFWKHFSQLGGITEMGCNV